MEQNKGKNGAKVGIAAACIVGCVAVGGWYIGTQEAAEPQDRPAEELALQLEDELSNQDQQIIENISIELSDLTEYQLQIFKDTSHYLIEGILIGETPAQIHTQQEFILESFIMENELPQNALLLFKEWKDSVDYDAKLVEWAGSQGTKVETNTNVEVPDEEITDSTINVPQQQNKPQPSQQQQQTQQKPTYDKDNLPDGTWIDEAGEVRSDFAAGYEEDGGSLHFFAQALMIDHPGITYEEAYEMAKELYNK